ncbi:MAG: hypothetical protein WBH31_08100 [Promethearchaeia archaeon]
MEKLSNELNLNKTQVFIRAFHAWIDMHKSKITIDMMSISRNTFKEMINYVTKEVVEKLAIKAARSFSNRYKLELHLHLKKNSKLEIISHLLNLFELKGFNWFNSTEIFLITPEHYRLQMIHSLNENASIFFNNFITYIMEEVFQFQLVESSLTDETIEIEFEGIEEW